MKKRILPLVLLILVLLCPLHTRAVAPLEPDTEASLSLCYQKDGIAFGGLQIGIYRVAEALPDGSFALLDPYASYPIRIHDITAQEQWHQVAQTLWAYITADGLAPDHELPTNDAGQVLFSGLKTGLYFVREAVAESTAGTYVFNQFMVYVPAPQPDGSYSYAVAANPKSTEFVPKTQYTVTKLWQDEGNQDTRPDSVTVDIYKDGVLQETRLLSAENNWSYTWNVSGEDYSQWTVAERTVPDGYGVMVRSSGTSFFIINTRQGQSQTPQTGDSFAPLPWILAMCLSGGVLLILGIYSWRRRK